MRKTLQDIARKLNQENDKWLLAGKTAAVLQGAMLHAHKLTIYCNQVTAYRFNNYFEEYRTLKVKHRAEPPLSGHAGTFDISGVEVSVVGDPAIVYEHKTFILPIDMLLQQVQAFSLDSESVPLLPPEWLVLLGIIGNDHELAKALVSLNVDARSVLDCAGVLGLSFQIKTVVEEFFKTV